MIKKFSFLSLLTLFFIQVCYWVTLSVPKWNFYDVNVPNTQIQGKSSLVLDTIAFVNYYLWFTIWLICFIFFIINGIKLVMARGDKEEFKKIQKAFLGTGVGIVVCFLSYSFVRLVINLFS